MVMMVLSGLSLHRRTVVRGFVRRFSRGVMFLTAVRRFGQGGDPLFKVVRGAFNAGGLAVIAMRVGYTGSDV